MIRPRVFTFKRGCWRLDRVYMYVQAYVYVWAYMKAKKMFQAKKMFANTGVQITAEGSRCLGAAIGSTNFKKDYLMKKVNTWLAELNSLVAIAKSQPQAAYSVFTQGLKHKWSFICRTMKDAATALASLEKALASSLIPNTLCDRDIGSEERCVMSFPCRDGGLGLINPTTLSTLYQASLTITAPLVAKIIHQDQMLHDAVF